MKAGRPHHIRGTRQTQEYYWFLISFLTVEKKGTRLYERRIPPEGHFGYYTFFIKASAAKFNMNNTVDTQMMGDTSFALPRSTFTRQ